MVFKVKGLDSLTELDPYLWLPFCPEGKTKQPQEPKSGTTNYPQYVHSTVVCRKVTRDHQSSPGLWQEKTEGLPETPFESLREGMVL